MGTLIAGDGGAVLHLAARHEADALAIEALGPPARTPSGIPVLPLEALPDAPDVHRVIWAGGEASSRARVEEWAAGRPVEDLPPHLLDAPAGVRVVAVSAPSTGSGKTALVRRVARSLRAMGRSIAVARHPIASLLHWDGRFPPVIVDAPPQLASPRPLPEREELAPLAGAGIPVATGLDPGGVLRLAAARAGPDGVVVFDGGGAAAPWVRSDLHAVVVDLLREPPPGTAERVGSADVVVLTKADTAPADRARAIEQRVSDWNPSATVVLCDLPVMVQDGPALRRRDVVLVEDHASLVLGGLRAGAGAVAAKRFGCGVIDPRPFAVGAVRDVLAAHPHIGGVIPSIGRTPDEVADLAASVRATPGDAVLWASNADPAHVLRDEERPVIRAYGELTEVAGPSLQHVLEERL